MLSVLNMTALYSLYLACHIEVAASFLGGLRVRLYIVRIQVLLVGVSVEHELKGLAILEVAACVVNVERGWVEVSAAQFGDVPLIWLVRPSVFLLRI